MTRKMLVLKITVCSVLAIWICCIVVLIMFWDKLPAWAIALIAIFEFIVGADARIFKVPFMSEDELKNFPSK